MKKIFIVISRFFKDGVTFETLLPVGTNYLKGVGILMIVFHNYFHWVAPNTGENEFDFSLSRVHSIGKLLGASPFELINILFSFFGHYGVQIFIVLSGYGLVRQMVQGGKTWTQFSLSSRMQKIYSLLFVSFLTALFFTFYADKVIPGAEWFRSMGFYVLMINSLVPGQLFAINGPWWFFGLIFQFYLVFPVLYWVLDRFKDRGILVLGVLSYLLIYVGTPLIGRLNLNIMATVFGHLPEFLLGMWLASRSTIKIPGWALILAVALIYGGNYVGVIWPFSFIGVSVFMLMLLWRSGLKAQDNINHWRFLVYVGGLSMYLFAIHGFLRYPFVNLANKYTNPGYTLIISLVYFIVVLILSVGVKQLMDYFSSGVKTLNAGISRLGFWSKVISQVRDFNLSWLRFFWILVLFHYLMRLVEFVFGKLEGALVAVDFVDYLSVILFYDISVIVVLAFFWYLSFQLVSLINRRVGVALNYIFIVLYALGSTLLVGYFLYSRVPLDHSILSYSISESIAIAGSSGFPSIRDFVLFGVVIVTLILLIKFVGRSKDFLVGWIVLGTGLLFIISAVPLVQKPAEAKDVTTYSGSVNKLYLFVSSCYSWLNSTNNLSTENQSLVNAFERYKKGSQKQFVNFKYPFWHTDKYQDVLGKYINKPSGKPNIVFIVVESLGSDVCGPNTRFKGVTPFLDSLITHSLYWPNTLATSQRTFGVLPGLLGSLPFGTEGFLKLREAMPKHETIMSRLKANGYTLTFNYGGYPEFQDMDAFIKRNRFDRVLPNPFFNPAETPKNEFNQWGFHDAVMFSKAIDAITEKEWNSPRMDFYLTLSTHDPFDFYGNERFDKIMDKIIERNTSETRSIMLSGKGYFSAVNYTDNSIKNLIEMYANKPGYENTIFIITGDHSSDFGASKSFLNKYNVPLIIFSPLVKQAQEFKAVNSHWDIVPSLLAYLRDNCGINSSDESAFLGDGLDTSKEFRNIHEIPFMLNNRSVTEFLSREQLVVDNTLFSLNPDMTLTQKSSSSQLADLKEGREAFKVLSKYVCNENKLLMDLGKEMSSLVVYKASYDYEKKDSTLQYHDKLSKERAISGFQSYHLQKTMEFGFMTDDQLIPASATSIELSISAKIYVIDFGKEFAKVVFEVADENGNNVIYDKSSLKTLNNSPVGNAVWNNMIDFKVFDLPSGLKGKKLKVKLYFWNKDGSDFFMDDLNVKYVVN